MKLGILGLPQAGKSTVFEALTGAKGDTSDYGGTRKDARMATVPVLDERVDFLKDLYRPKKSVYAKIEYLLPSEVYASSGSKSEGAIWNQLRICDGLLHVIRNFQEPSGEPPAPIEDFQTLEEEMILNDLVVAEKRIERIELDRKRGKKPEGEEFSLVQSCRQVLEQGQPLREIPELASAPALKGFTFLSAKPMLVLINNDDEDDALPEWTRKPEAMDMVVVRGRLERDIASMSAGEAEEFLEAYAIEDSAMDRVIKSSYALLNLISFFTVNAEEARAWSIPAGTPALKAAGTVHSDMERGFIRAEVVAFEDLRACGTFQEAKKAGLVRLEGKEYEVKDGDLIQFRFNV